MIVAVGETVDLDFAKASGLQIKEGGTIEVNHFTLETSRPHFYAGGDLVTGASNVSNAMGYGKQAARAIDRAADGCRALGAAVSVPCSTARRRPRSRATAAAIIRTLVPARERASSFDEVVDWSVAGRDPRGVLPLPALRRDGGQCRARGGVSLKGRSC